MTVLYKAVQKSQPGVVGGGTTKYYAGIVREKPIFMRKFAAEIARMNTLTVSDVYAVLEAFMERLPVYLEEGRIVKMGEFGSFSPSLLSHSEEASAEVDQNTIRKLKINFRPSRELQHRLSNVKFKKVNPANGSDNVE